MMINMYKDPLLAVVRELMSNAADEHARLKLDRKFTVTMPSMTSPTFIVRDYADGLSEEEVYNLITGIGSSGAYKRQDVHTTGGFGIGAKCPATITDQWVITSHYQGIKKVYSAFKAETGNLQLTKLGETPTDETGLEVAVPIETRFLNQINGRLAAVLEAYSQDERPEIRGIDSRNIPASSRIISTDIFDVCASNYGSGNAAVILNRVRYPLDSYQFPSDKNVQFWLSQRIHIKITKAEEKALINVTPSREALIYTPQLKQLIQEKLVEISSVFATEVQKLIDQADSFISAQQIRTKFKGTFHTYLVELENLTYEGKPFKFADVLDMTAALDITSAFWLTKMPEVYKLAKVSSPDETYFDFGLIGRVIKHSPKSNLILNRSTQRLVPFGENFNWYLNDVPETWRSTPRKYLNYIKKQKSQNNFVIINNIPGLVEHLEKFFPKLGKHFSGKLSDFSNGLANLKAANKKIRQPAKPTIKSESDYLDINRAKFCVWDNFDFGAKTAQGFSTEAARKLKGPVVYIGLDNLANIERCWTHAPVQQANVDSHVAKIKSFNGQVKPMYLFMHKLSTMAGLEAFNIVGVQYKYLMANGVPNGWISFDTYFESLPLKLRKINKQVYAELLDLLVLTEIYLGASQSVQTALKDVTNSRVSRVEYNKHIFELLKDIRAYSTSAIKSNNLNKLITATNKAKRLLTNNGGPAITFNDALLLGWLGLNTTRGEFDSPTVLKWLNITGEEWENVPFRKAYIDNVSQLLQKDLTFKVLLYRHAGEDPSLRYSNNIAVSCITEIRHILMPELFHKKIQNHE